MHKQITLGIFFLLFECCLDFYNWFWVFFAQLNKEMASVSLHQARFFCEVDLTKSITFFGIISWFLSTHIILNMFLREKMFCQQQILTFTNPSARAGYDTRSIFKRSLTGLNSEFSFSSTSCLNRAEEPSLPYYLPIAGRRIFGFIPFPRVLVLCEMQSVSSRIWTRVAVFISYDDNNYTTGTSWRYIGYLIETSITGNWIVAIDKGKYT